MKRYVPSGDTEEGAQIALIVTVLVTAIAVGGLANLIGQFIRLLFVFPAVMGAMVGLAAVQIALAKKMRTPAFVIFVAVLGGLACFSTDFGIDYWRTRSDIHDQVALVASDLEAQGLGVPDDDDHTRTVDVVLQYWAKGWEVNPLVMAVNLLEEPLSDDTGATLEPSPAPTALEAFVAHVQGLASQGTTISDVGRDDDGDNIGAIGTYLLWLLDLLIIVGVAGGMTWEQVRQPFCERCKDWFQKDERVVAIAPATAGAAVLGAMQSGNTHGLASAYAPLLPKKPFIAIGIRACKKCSSGQRFVDVCRITIKGGKTKRKSLGKGLVESGKLEDQLQALTDAATKAQEGTA